MRTSIGGLALALLGGFAAIAPAAAQNRVEIGVLNCQVAGGIGFIVGSSKSLDCAFDRPGRNERYAGTIQKFGIDIGSTKQSVLSWAVFAPTGVVPDGALQGSYGGVTGEATVGVGVGANALIGGNNKTISLQPLSVQAQQGLNIAAGVAAIELRLVK